MNFPEATIRILFLIFPGIISAIIFEQLTIRKTSWSQFRFLLHSFVLGVFNYVILQAILNAKYWTQLALFGHGRQERIQFWGAMFDKATPVNMHEVLWACVAAVPLGLILTKAAQYKWLSKFARRWKFSHKYGEENLFTYFLGSGEITWIFIRDFNHKLSYYGNLVKYSECDDLREVVMTDVSVHNLDDSKEIYSVPVIYLSYKVGDLVIEIPEGALKGAEHESA